MICFVRIAQILLRGALRRARRVFKFAYGRWTSLKTTRDGSTWDETQWTYDEASGVQAAKTYADGSVVRHDYDEEGRPTRTTWARGAWFENRYDEWGQVVAVAHDDPSIDAEMSYDAFGRLVSSSNNAAAYRYTYDDRGLVTNELAVIGGITNTIVRDFDDYDRPVRLRIADSDYDQTYAYDNKGRLSVIGIPGSTVTYAYTPDSLDAGYSVLTPSNAILTRALTRDPLRRGLITVVSNYVTRVDGDQENLSPLPSNLSPCSFVYTYDALGRPVARNLDEFGYNARGEVAWARYGTNTLADIYDYDFIGNFTSNRLRGAWSQFAANELNEYASIANLLTSSTPSTTTLAYDRDGNLLTNGVWSYTYDSLNRLSVVCSNDLVVTENAYDPFHRRVFCREPSGEHGYLYDDWNPIREIVTSAETTTPIDRCWGKDLSGALQGVGGVGGLLAANHHGMLYFPGYDNLGNIVLYFDVSGETVATFFYDAFGQTIVLSGEHASSFTNRHATRQANLSTGLHHYGFRFYDAACGRWLGRDAINENGGINLYSFSFNNPFCFVDCVGMVPVSWGRSLLDKGTRESQTSCICFPLYFPRFSPFASPVYGERPSVFQHFRFPIYISPIPPILGPFPVWQPAFELVVGGPANNSVLNENQWFEWRYPNMLMSCEWKYVNLIGSKLAAMCGTDISELDIPDSETRLIIEPFYNDQDGGGWWNKSHGVHMYINSFWETDWGDRPQSKYEAFSELGTFEIDIETPITIQKISSEKGCVFYEWQTKLYVQDHLGLNENDKFPNGVKRLTPERNVKRAEWVLSGSFYCCKGCL